MDVAYPKLRDWLRDQLRRREWTQADLARQMEGTDTGTVSRWVRGERRPSPESCEHLAEAFNVRYERVMVVAGYLPDLSEDDNEALADLESMLRRMKLTRIRERALRTIIEGFIEEDREGFVVHVDAEEESITSRH